jgi:hypothetical protein
VKVELAIVEPLPGRIFAAGHFLPKVMANLARMRASAEGQNHGLSGMPAL